MSLDIRIDARGLLPAQTAMDRLSALDGVALLDGLARRIQVQTRNRIEEEKTSPAGAPWKPNSQGTPTLYQSGALSTSIESVVSAMQAVVGSGLVYARIHQYGGVIEPKNKDALAFTIGGQAVVTQKVTIPARPYLGVSSDNAAELTDAAARFIRKAVGL